MQWKFQTHCYFIKMKWVDSNNDIRYKIHKKNCNSRERETQRERAFVQHTWNTESICPFCYISREKLSFFVCIAFFFASLVLTDRLIVFFSFAIHHNSIWCYLLFTSQYTCWKYKCVQKKKSVNLTRQTWELPIN